MLCWNILLDEKFCFNPVYNIHTVYLYYINHILYYIYIYIYIVYISLHTNFPHAYCLEALSYRIDKNPGSLHENLNEQFVL